MLACLIAMPAMGQGTGGLAGGLRIEGPERDFHFADILVQSLSGGSGIRTMYREGSFFISGIPVGPAEICVRSSGYHTIFDTVTIKKKGVMRREFVLVPAPERTEPYPDCDRSLPVVYAGEPGAAPVPVPTPDAFAIWEGLLRFYRSSVRTSEGDYVRRTFRVTKSSADTVGPASVVLSLHRDVPPTTDLLDWFAALADRGFIEATCDEIDVAHCPQETVTTFISLPEPRRINGDTVDVLVHEIGLNPASCRTEEGGFVGTWRRGFILVLRDDRWEVVGRSPEGKLTSSGYCRPEPEEGQ